MLENPAAPPTRSDFAFRAAHGRSALRATALAAAVFCALCAALPLHAQAARQSQAQSATPAPDSSEIPTDPRALYQALDALRPDSDNVYEVKNLRLRRDVISITLTDGKLAFFQPIGGRITGAVFTGRGHIIATPRDSGERRSLAEFLGVPILDQPFSSAYFRFTDGTADELQQKLDDSEAEESTDSQFTASWESTVRDFSSWHSLRILEDLLAVKTTGYFYAAFGGAPAGPFEALVDARRSEQVLIGQPRTVKDENFFDVWASFPATPDSAGDASTASPVASPPVGTPSGSPPESPPVPFIPLNYQVDTSIAGDLSLAGATTLHLKTIRPGERVVPLEISRNLAVDQVSLAGGAPLVFFQNEDLSRREVQRRGNNSLLVVLPAVAQSGQEFQILVKYHGSVIADAGNGVEFVGEHDDWYAHTGGLVAFVPFDLTFRWPRRFTLVATGTKIDSSENAETKSAHFRSEVPFAVAGFNLGEYKSEIIGSRPVIEIFANPALETAIAARLHVDGHLPVPPFPGAIGGQTTNQADRVYSSPAPSPADAIKQLGFQISDSIRFFEKLNGPFPFTHLDVSQIPGSFGQGWPGLVYLSTYAFLPPEAQEEAGLSQRAQRTARELFPFHEVAHQWWGNLTTAGSYRDGWMQEAMANYLALLYADHKDPNQHRMADWLNHFRAMLETKHAGDTIAPEQAGPLTLGFRLTSSKSPGAYETVIYDKGAWVMRMLDAMLRDPNAPDPDARFRALLLTTLTDYRFRPITTLDFQHEVEKQMTPAMDLDGTKSMAWFFDEWVQNTGIPHYHVDFKVAPRGKDFLVTGILFQSETDDTFSTLVPLYGARGAGKSQPLGVVTTLGAETRFRFVVRDRPNRILIDPQLTVLCVVDSASSRLQ
ncbi:MAG: M1 family aminopeptidase [Candidatus Acidiferrales bacterium]